MLDFFVNRENKNVCSNLVALAITIKTELKFNRDFICVKLWIYEFYLCIIILIATLKK